MDNFGYLRIYFAINILANENKKVQKKVNLFSVHCMRSEARAYIEDFFLVNPNLAYFDCESEFVLRVHEFFPQTKI